MANKWKSLLQAVETGVGKAAHLQRDPAKSEKLTTWTAYGNLAEDPLAPLLERPVEVLRLFKLRGAAPLAQLSRFPRLRAVFFEDCNLEPAQAIDAALAVSTLELFMLWIPRTASSVVPAALTGGLARLQAVELRGATLGADSVRALFGGRGLVDVALSRKGNEETSVVIEDQPALRRLALNLCGKQLQLSRLPVLEALELGGSFDELRLEGLPQVRELELPIGERARLSDLGLVKMTVEGLSELELTGVPALKKLDLRAALESLGPERVRALRAALPHTEVLPAEKKR